MEGGGARIRAVAVPVAFGFGAGLHVAGERFPGMFRVVDFQEQPASFGKTPLHLPLPGVGEGVLVPRRLDPGVVARVEILEFQEKPPGTEPGAVGVAAGIAADMGETAADAGDCPAQAEARPGAGAGAQQRLHGLDLPLLFDRQQKFHGDRIASRAPESPAMRPISPCSPARKRL